VIYDLTECLSQDSG